MYPKKLFIRLLPIEGKGEKVKVVEKIVDNWKKE
jgi:hypothetical protein